MRARPWVRAEDARSVTPHLAAFATGKQTRQCVTGGQGAAAGMQHAPTRRARTLSPQMHARAPAQLPPHQLRDAQARAAHPASQHQGARRVGGQGWGTLLLLLLSLLAGWHDLRCLNHQGWPLPAMGVVQVLLWRGRGMGRARRIDTVHSTDSCFHTACLLGHEHPLAPSLFTQPSRAAAAAAEARTRTCASGAGRARAGPGCDAAAGHSQQRCPLGVRAARPTAQRPRPTEAGEGGAGISWAAS